MTRMDTDPSRIGHKSHENVPCRRTRACAYRRVEDSRRSPRFFVFFVAIMDRKNPRRTNELRRTAARRRKGSRGKTPAFPLFPSVQWIEHMPGSSSAVSGGDAKAGAAHDDAGRGHRCGREPPAFIARSSQVRARSIIARACFSVSYAVTEMGSGVRSWENKANERSRAQSTDSDRMMSCIRPRRPWAAHEVAPVFTHSRSGDGPPFHAPVVGWHTGRLNRPRVRSRRQVRCYRSSH